MVMNRRDSLPPLHEMTTVQVKGQYSVSRADGHRCYSGGGKCHNSPRAPLLLSAFYQRSGERGRGEEPAPTAASSRNSLPA